MGTEFKHCGECELRSACKAVKRCTLKHQADEEPQCLTALIFLYLLERSWDMSNATSREELIEWYAGGLRASNLTAIANFGTIAQVGTEQGKIAYYVDGDCKVPSTIRLGQLTEALAKRNQRRSKR